MLRVASGMRPGWPCPAPAPPTSGRVRERVHRIASLLAAGSVLAIALGFGALGLAGSIGAWSPRRSAAPRRQPAPRPAEDSRPFPTSVFTGTP